MWRLWSHRSVNIFLAPLVVIMVVVVAVCECGGGICRRAWEREPASRPGFSRARPSLASLGQTLVGAGLQRPRTLRARILLRRQFPFPGLQASLRQFLRGARDHLQRRGGEA